MGLQTSTALEVLLSGERPFCRPRSTFAAEESPHAWHSDSFMEAQQQRGAHLPPSKRMERRTRRLAPQA